METKKGISEDWLSLWLGLAIFVLSIGTFLNTDLLGWGTRTGVWTKAGAAFAPISKTYDFLPGLASLAITYIFVQHLLNLLRHSSWGSLGFTSIIFSNFRYAFSGVIR